jgi:hypothetical protein
MKKRLAHVALFEGGHITSLRRLFSRERGFERNGDITTVDEHL